MTIKENRKKALENICKALNDIEESNYIVCSDGRLCYNKLVGLELNAIYEDSITGLCSLGHTDA